MPDKEEHGTEYEKVVNTYYGEEPVTAIITLKVDTKEVDNIAVRVAEAPSVDDVFLVTGDTDIILKTTFKKYSQLKEFVMERISPIPGVEESSTWMVVTTYKENGKKRFK
jgi:Lrp/AsnC family leucine-responsive transcriptional regulator